MDCAKLIHEYNLKNIVVTNGYICKEPLLELLPYIDAMNIDLKGFSNDFYNKVNGNFDIIKTNIELAIKSTHVEITTLIIPNINDSIEEMKQLSAWLSEIDDNVVLHISRFFPRYKMQNVHATPISTVKLLVNTARTNLKYVYAGNI